MVSGDFPAVYDGEIKYHVMLENSPVFSSHGLCYLMAGIKDPRPDHLLLLLRHDLLGSTPSFCVPASQEAAELPSKAIARVCLSHGHPTFLE